MKHYKYIKVFFLLVALVGVTACSSNGAEKESKKALEEMGAEFYEEYYYDLVTVGMDEVAKEAFFAQSNNAKTTLPASSVENMSEIKVKDQIKVLKDNKCNLDKSKVVITPEKPYGKEDYKIEAEASCK